MTKLPLEGVRVIDFTVVWAGTFGTLTLADLGAEVIKVENPFVMQPMTRGGMARPTAAMLKSAPALQGGYPNGDPGPRAWNYNPTFVQLYRNKKSFTVDIRRPEGMDILKRLIAVSDVVYENNATETMEGLGITYDWLKSIKPDIIMARVPAYGSTGPYSNARALGVHLESVAGHTLLRGYEGMTPDQNSAIFSGDYLGGVQGALAVMMALWHRKQTGEGQLIELGQAENASGMLFQAFMEYTLNHRTLDAMGNHSIYGAAPCGVYPCISPGTVEDAGDHWISITVTNDDEWKALREIMGDPEWARNARFDTAESRAANQDVLDREIAEWTVAFEDYDLFHRLQAAGVPAAPVLQGSRVMDDPHVQARGLFKPMELYDKVGTFRFAQPFFKFSETPIEGRTPPVAMGEYNDYVYRDVIGVSEEEYEALKAGGHVSMDFDASVP
ncbi:MAG: CaiB/BaiF CoA transferase family protein [Tepidiformaceae bacterium]